MDGAYHAEFGYREMVWFKKMRECEGESGEYRGEG